MAKREIISVHTVTLDERKWLLVLLCINAFSCSIVHFYIFRDKSFWHNFIIRCGKEVCMAIQKNVNDGNIVQWVDQPFPTSHWSNAWHFNQELAFIDNRWAQLLCTLDISYTAQEIDLDFLTILSHTYHATQHLDLNCSKWPLKNIEILDHYK